MKGKIVLLILAITVTLCLALVYFAVDSSETEWTDTTTNTTLGIIDHYIVMHYSDGTQAKIKSPKLFTISHDSKPVEFIGYVLQGKTDLGSMVVDTTEYYLTFLIKNEVGEEILTYVETPTETSQITVTDEWTDILLLSIDPEELMNGLGPAKYTVTLQSRGSLSYKLTDVWNVASSPEEFDFIMEVTIDSSGLTVIIGGGSSPNFD